VCDSKFTVHKPEVRHLWKVTYFMRLIKSKLNELISRNHGGQHPAQDKHHQVQTKDDECLFRSQHPWDGFPETTSHRWNASSLNPLLEIPFWGEHLRVWATGNVFKAQAALWKGKNILLPARKSGACANPMWISQSSARTETALSSPLIGREWWEVQWFPFLQNTCPKTPRDNRNHR
jgi:hypothetical protein